MSRLDRLVSLLDTGFSSYVRNVAAEQIADVQKTHPEELFNLLGRVTPFLQSSKWDTRIAAAKAIGLIAENTIWDPTTLPDIDDDYVKAEVKHEITEIKDEVKSEITDDAKSLSSANETDSKVAYGLDKAPMLTFSELDISNVIIKGTPLLGSAGREYDHAIQSMDVEQRLRIQMQTLNSKIGLDFVESDLSNSLLDEELAQPTTKRNPSKIEAPQEQESKQRGKKASLKREEKVEEEDSKPKGAVNARMRALAKRKAKLGGGSPAPPAKSRALDVDNQSNSKSSSSSHSGGKSDSVVVQHVDHADRVVESLTISDPCVFPLKALCFQLTLNLFEPSWEVRHGALLCLREIIRVHGKTAGMVKGKSYKENEQLNNQWLENLACRFCCVFALDRFADYVADQAVAPVRESCAQALAALLLDIPESIARDTLSALNTLIMDPMNTGVWAACHGGMLGLRYFVTIRKDLIIGDQQLFTELVNCVFKGLSRRDDDEVQAISAAVLLPISQEFANQRPKEEIAKLINIMWDCISELKDELTVAVGNIMDLLANLCVYSNVIDLFLEDKGESLALLIPRLYPFFRHSITDVRKAVLRSLSTFLKLQHVSKDWVNLTLVRLVFQNILLEQNAEVLELSMELWNLLIGCFAEKIDFSSMFLEFWPIAYDLLMTPIGTARRFYKMNLNYLIKPNGELTYAAAKPNANANKLDVDIDGPVISGDTLIVDYREFIRAKVYGSKALGHATACALQSSFTHDSNGDYQKIFGMMNSSLQSHFNSLMSSQLLVLGFLIEDICNNMTTPTEEFRDSMNPYLTNCLDNSKPKILWRDINPILRTVRTQCQSLFTILMNQNELPMDCFPKLPTTVEGDPCDNEKDCFTLAQAWELADTTFFELKGKLSQEVQVRMAQTLEDGRQNLLDSITEAENALESRNISIRAMAAAAFISLNKNNLPIKLNPIIRGLMDEVKTEQVLILHEKAASVLAELINVLLDNDRVSAATKVVKNLCGFLCIDVHEAPEFDSTVLDHIISLKKDDVKYDNKNVSEQLRKDRENHSAFIKRQGALLTLSKICMKYKENTFTKLQIIREQIFSAIVKSTNEDNADGVNDPENGQVLIDSMAVLHSLVPFFDRALYPEIFEYMPALLKILFSKFSVVRHVAARCIASICKVMPTKSLTFVVDVILKTKITDASNVYVRQGSIEAVYHIVNFLGEDILPYLVFFIVPVLGRMSDSDHDIRIVAATTFASIIKLAPLEAGVQDPDDLPQSLLESKYKEREFIGQMMDPSKIKEFKLPIAVNAELRKYQHEGVNWLAFLNKYHLHGVLCDDMGLGKTLQTICMVASDHVIRDEEYKKTKNEDMRKLPSLIICPTTLTGHWVEEFAKYVPSLKVLALIGSPKTRQITLNSGAVTDHDIVVTSYDTARNEVDKLSKYDWNYCVLDEGHIIKNTSSKLSKAVKQYRAYHRLILTGTPIQNNVLELWSLFDFLMPGFLGSEKSFNDRFSKPIAARSSGKASPADLEAATLALEGLHKQVLPFTLRRLKEDVLDDLPPKIIQDYYCDLNDIQQNLYNKFTKQQKSGIEQDTEEGSESSRKHIFQALQYMRKLCNHPAFVQYTKSELANHIPLKISESPKLLALQQLLKDCGIGNTDSGVAGVPEAVSQHRALIFCQQREMLDLVEKSLLQTNMPSVSYLRMDGSTPGPSRQKMVTKFNDDPSIDVLLLTTHVGGLGLNLTGADTVIFVEHDWNPMNDLQAMDRAHRLGQKRVVNVYRLITRHTLEERIMGLQQFKLNIASSVINQQNKGLLSMGTEQILDLFSSSAETVDNEAPKPETKEAVDITGKVGGTDLGSTLGELWDETEYAEEYNIDNFIKSLKK
ncbi:DNA-binding ATPase [Starmerella bacillaris]|uniref:DNA-binding ATPase n=1 Tax=Starmerella bacillaris TaxID=1247836 RepID=A0AAV5RJF9_STABA|nr:DNA-binding ATPase [Starmerella bacillaris]